MAKPQSTPKPKPHKWQFRPRFRRNSFGWKSQPAIKRVKEAVAEIKKVARKDKVLAAEGAVIFLEKVSPALEHVDSSSGAIGAAVNKAVEELAAIIAAAPLEEAQRQKFLERLFKAHGEDEIPYIELLAEYWGQMCVTEEIASHWADELLFVTNSVMKRKKESFEFFHGTSACLSALYAAGRHQELMVLLKEERFWDYAVWGLKAMVALGHYEAALEKAEELRDQHNAGYRIDLFCEEILLAQGKEEEAYQQYGLRSAQANTNLAWFRAVAKKYPHKEKPQILADLVKITPGEEGKWFAAAKSVQLYDEAIALAFQSPTSPQTLTRAARDFREKEPRFALEAGLAALHWLAQGYGYEVTSMDIMLAHDHTMQAAHNAGVAAETEAFIRNQVAPQAHPQSLVAKVLKERLGGWG